MSHHPESRLNATALLSLLVGVFGTVCFLWGIAGIGAIVLGMVGHAEIKRSEGRQRGSGLAIAGIILGVLHIVALVIGIAVLLTLAASKSATAVMPPAGTPPTFAPKSVAPGVPSAAPAPKSADQPGAVTRESGTRSTHFGGVTLIDPGSDETTLAALIESELAEAASNNEKLMLFISTPDCAPCTGVSLALGNKRLQAALSGVRLLRVDARDYQLELTRRGFPIDVMPGFALIGARGEPRDYVNGGEWDADIAENIAPVLGSFARGTYRQRRNAWRGVLRGDETAL